MDMNSNLLNEKRKKKKKKEEVILTPEENFARLLALKKATRCILGIEDEYKIYVRLAKEFKEMGEKAKENPFEGSDRCEALSKECLDKAGELKLKLPEHREEISRTVTTTMKEQEEKSGRKKGKKKWIALVVIVIIAAGAICYKLTPTRYLIAGIEQELSLKKYAMESYHRLGDYKDSREKASQTMYEYACSLQEDGDWKEAWKFFSRLAETGYQDSAARALKVEKQIITSAALGDTIHFGNSDWIVLDKKDGSVLLARYKTIQGEQAEDAPIPGEVYEESGQKTTWDNSSLRSYLNGSFIQEEFSAEERSAIRDTNLVHADNKVFGTSGGTDTVDKVFILSAEEIERYSDLLKDKAKNLRLRNPGADQDSTAYYSHLKEVIYYGFPLGQKGVYNRPVIWVDYEDQG